MNPANTNSNPIFWGPLATLADVLLYLGIAIAAMVVALTGLRTVLTANLGDTAVLRVYLFKRFSALIAALALVILAPNIAVWVSERIGTTANAVLPEWIKGLYNFIRGFLAPIARSIFAIALQIDGIRNLAYLMQYWEHPEADEAAQIVQRVLVLSALLAIFEAAPAIVQALASAASTPAQ